MTPLPPAPTPEPRQETPNWQYDLSLEMIFRNGIGVASAHFDSTIDLGDFITVLAAQTELSTLTTQNEALTRRLAQVKEENAKLEADFKTLKQWFNELQIKLRSLPEQIANAVVGSSPAPPYPTLYCQTCGTPIPIGRDRCANLNCRTTKWPFLFCQICGHGQTFGGDEFPADLQMEGQCDICHQSRTFGPEKPETKGEV